MPSNDLSAHSGGHGDGKCGGRDDSCGGGQVVVVEWLWSTMEM